MTAPSSDPGAVADDAAVRALLGESLQEIGLRRRRARRRARRRRRLLVAVCVVSLAGSVTAAAAAVTVAAPGELVEGSGVAAAPDGDAAVVAAAAPESEATPTPAARPRPAPPPPAASMPRPPAPPTTTSPTTTSTVPQEVFDYLAALEFARQVNAGREARALRANRGADPAQVAAIGRLVNFDWEAVLPGWQVRFEPGRAGLRGLTSFDARTVTVYVRGDLTAAQQAFDLGHELGHAVDADRLTDPERAAWRQARGISAETPWSWAWDGSAAGDYAMPAGDWAESFAVAVTGTTGEFQSRLAGPPSAAQVGLLRSLAA